MSTRAMQNRCVYASDAKACTFLAPRTWSSVARGSGRLLPGEAARDGGLAAAVELLAISRERGANGDVQGAVEVYREAVKAFPESPSLNTTLGLLYIQTGNHQAAFECLGTALAFEPQNSREPLLFEHVWGLPPWNLY